MVQIMKLHNQILKFTLVLLFFIMLISPKTVFIGASKGLLLWFQTVLPTLFPFLFITNLLLSTDSISFLSSAFGMMLSRIFRVSPNGSFAVLAGFLCGYPMGAKTASDLTVSGYISQEEGRYLLSFCNNTSPMFLMNFIIWKTLKKETLFLPALLIQLLTPIIISLFTRKRYLNARKCFQNSNAKLANVPHKTKKWSFTEIDLSIMNSFETLVKVGGYIILFSVLLALLQQVPANFMLLKLLLPTLEITNGVVKLTETNLPFSIQFTSIMALTAFGGLCSIAQTHCMIQKAGLPILPYIKEKLAAALTASLLTILYLHFK